MFMWEASDWWNHLWADSTAGTVTGQVTRTNLVFVIPQSRSTVINWMVYRQLISVKAYVVDVTTRGLDVFWRVSGRSLGRSEVLRSLRYRLAVYRDWWNGLSKRYRQLFSVKPYAVDVTTRGLDVFWRVSGRSLGRSEVLSSLRYRLRARSQAQHMHAGPVARKTEAQKTIQALRRLSSFERRRKWHRHSGGHWNCMVVNAWETSERRGGAHMRFSEHEDTIWT